MKKSIVWIAMGVAGSLFAQTKHEEKWMVYSHENDAASITVDVGLDGIAPVKALPNLFKLQMMLQSVTENNPVVSEAELEKVFAIENDLVEHLTKNEIYVGRVTLNGLRVFYIYTKSNAIEKIVASVMKRYPDYKYKTEFKSEPDWVSYLNVLSPTEKEYRMYLNSLVLDNLEENGDNPTKERAIEHWAYFATEKDRDLYLKEVGMQGYVLLKKEKMDGTLPYQLHIKKIGKTDVESVNADVLYLWETAPKFRGAYDGWETSIER